MDLIDDILKACGVEKKRSSGNTAAKEEAVDPNGRKMTQFVPVTTSGAYAANYLNFPEASSSQRKKSKEKDLVENYVEIHKDAAEKALSALVIKLN